MPITEVVFVHFKNDASVIAEREKVIPEAFTFFSTVPGVLSVHYGPVLREDGVDVSQERRVGLAIEWPTTEPFYEVLKSPGLAAFRQKLGPFVAKVVPPAIFTADQRSLQTKTTPVTQALRVTPSSNVEACKAAWAKLEEALQASEARPSVYSGVGIDENEGDFLGLIGWDSIEASEKVLETPAAKGALSSLLATGEASNLIVQLKPIEAK